MASKRTIVLTYLAGAVVVLLSVGLTLPFLLAPKVKLMNYRQVPDFELVDQDGHIFQSASLRGKVWLGSFLYTRCKGPCPLLANQLEFLQKDAFKGSEVKFVSISLDPEHDTVPVLAAYAKDHNAVQGRWVFLTGSKETIRNLAATGFSVTALDQQDPLNPIVHSTKFVLVDKRGVIRAFFDGGQPEKNVEILSAIRQLEREQ